MGERVEQKPIHRCCDEGIWPVLVRRRDGDGQLVVGNRDGLGKTSTGFGIDAGLRSPLYI